MKILTSKLQRAVNIAFFILFLIMPNLFSKYIPTRVTEKYRSLNISFLYYPSLIIANLFTKHIPTRVPVKCYTMKKVSSKLTTNS